QSGWSIVLGPGMRNPLAEERKSRFAQRSAVYRVGGEVSVVDAQSAKGDVEVPGAGLDWVGGEDTYFLTAVMPEAPVARIVVRPLLEEQAGPTEPYRFTPLPPKDQMTGAQKDLPRDLEVTVAAAGDQMKLRAFWGGKNYGILAAQGYGLEKTISQRWGTFRIL